MEHSRERPAWSRRAVAQPAWKAARRGSALLVPRSPPWPQYFSGSRPQAGPHLFSTGSWSCFRGYGPGLQTCRGSWSSVLQWPARCALFRGAPSCALSQMGRGRAVSKNPHPSCQSPDGSNRPYTGAATLHPGPGAQLHEGARHSRVTNLCAHPPRRTASLSPTSRRVSRQSLRVQGNL